MLALLLIAFVSAAAAADAGPRVQSIATAEPRPFGYFLGDVIRREVELDLKPGARLEAGSLPHPGPINYWLELRSVDVEEDNTGKGGRVHISLAYQAFYAALDPRRLTIPGFAVSVADDEGSEQAEIPAFGFVISPLREIFPGKESDTSSIVLRPDTRPPLVSTATERTAMLIGAPVGLAALVLLAMHYAWWPFHRLPGRPFTEAARFLRLNAAELAGEGGYRAALLKLHRAFDRSAGHRVLPDDLQTFLAEHPQYGPLSGDIRRLFACSRAVFYGNDLAGARAAMPLAEVAALGSRLGAAERSAA